MFLFYITRVFPLHSGLWRGWARLGTLTLGVCRGVLVDGPGVEAPSGQLRATRAGGPGMTQLHFHHVLLANRAPRPRPASRFKGWRSRPHFSRAWRGTQGTERHWGAVAFEVEAIWSSSSPSPRGHPGTSPSSLRGSLGSPSQLVGFHSGHESRPLLSHHELQLPGEVGGDFIFSFHTLPAS